MFWFLVIVAGAAWWILRGPGLPAPGGGRPSGTGASGAGPADPQVLAQLRAAREAGAREGFAAGLKRGRAEGYAEGARRGGAAMPPTTAAEAPPPRTRAEALRVLDLPEHATLDEVEARYRERRRAAHPDNFPRAKYSPAFVALAEAEFKGLGEARDLLVR
ncbi:MAG: hypothetical protein P1P87_09425 [Trueperaceae bacterium]|nr:hypothetical protein [Trueperaceae bacterium]